MTAALLITVHLQQSRDLLFFIFFSFYTFNISIPLGWLKNPFSERKRFNAFSNTPISFFYFIMTFWTDMS